jgi:hypothetical protein
MNGEAAAALLAAHHHFLLAGQLLFVQPVLGVALRTLDDHGGVSAWRFSPLDG